MVDSEEMSWTARTYRTFAEREARGRSSLYEEFSIGVADDPDLLERLTSLPRPKRQPNLLFGVVRYVYELAIDYPDYRARTIEHWEDVSAAIMAMRTQTNEVARCATLLPLLAGLPQPLALFEVGAS